MKNEHFNPFKTKDSTHSRALCFCSRVVKIAGGMERISNRAEE